MNIIKTKSTSASGAHILPAELWASCFSWLPAFQSGKIASVCSAFNKNCNAPQVCNSWLVQFSPSLIVESTHDTNTKSKKSAAGELRKVLKEFPKSCFRSDSSNPSPWEGTGRMVLICARLGFDASVARLIRNDPRLLEVTSLDKSTSTPLHTACFHGQDAVVSALLDGGANPQAQTALGVVSGSFGQTALSVAAGKGHASCVDILLRHSITHAELDQLRYGQPRPAKVNVFDLDNDGWDAAQIADAKGHHGIAEAIRQKQQDLRPSAVAVA